MADESVVGESTATDTTTTEHLSQEREADMVPLKEESGLAQDDIDPYQKSSIDAEAAYEEAIRSTGEGADETRTIQQFLRAAKIAETAHEWQLAAVSLQIVGNYLCRPGGIYNLDRAFRLFQRAVMAYEQCGLFRESRELTYRILYLKMRHCRALGLRWRDRAELYFFWATSGFGIRPFRVVIMALVLIWLFAGLFWLTEGVVQGRGEVTPLSFAENLYFSGVTFVTIGYGDLLPAPHARFLALSEGALGMITLSYFVVVLSNRLGKH